MKLKIKFSRHFGFTLVELLVVIAISGILASVSYIGIQEVRKTIRDNKRRADLSEVARALELFKADYGQYPPNTYLSSAYAPGGELRSLMPFLKDGGALPLGYKTATGFSYKSVSFSGGYLKDYIRDPINHVEPGYDGYMYAYFGPGYISVTDASSFIDDVSDFPMLCDDQVNTCGTGTGHDGTWGQCCEGGCLDLYCDFDNQGNSDPEDDTLFWFNKSSTFGLFCYGPDSKRGMGLLMTRLEKNSKPEERIENVFSFCPTADVSNPYHVTYFNRIKQLMPRGKECYSGEGDDNYDCDGDAWGYWALNEYNYFVPLTGEFNLR